MVSLVSAARDLGRVREISAVLVRHGFGEFVRRLGLVRSPRSSGAEPEASQADEARGTREREEISLAVRARMVLEDLGPSFVKLGQIASTRPDLLPADLITELKKLQDSVAPLPFEQIKEQVERSLGAPVTDVFARFNEEPLAA